MLLVLVASVQTPVGQLLKLPLLVEHFLKHHQQNSLSLMDFLDVHYTSPHKDADFPEDEQLPFKNSNIHAIGYAIVTPVFETSALEIPAIQQKMALPDIHLPQLSVGGIFRPPKM